MKISANLPHLIFTVIITAISTGLSAQENSPELFPAQNAVAVNPDTHLELRFSSPPVAGTSGKIKVYDAATGVLADMIDMSIPAGPSVPVTGPKAPYLQFPYPYERNSFATNLNTKPGTPSAGALPANDSFQLTIIGGFTDGFHFFPVIIHGNTAMITLHHNLLQYGRTYYVEIDPGVIKTADGSFSGIQGKQAWRFSTKKNAPSSATHFYTVSGDGRGDFNTVQGALDFIPDHQSKRNTVFIKNGLYEEIVYFRNKTNITIVGESRDHVIVQYANREVFNPHPANISTNEMPGTFPSRRAAFMADNSNGIHLVNFTVRTTAVRAQAEGLLLNGKENIVYNVTIGGSGDALQTNGTAYYKQCLIEGWGDMVLGRGAAFFENCELRAEGPYMWIRNTETSHGNVFLNCTFSTPNGKETVIARLPTNGGKDYPCSEAVLINCLLSGITAEGWGPIGGPTANIHYWEYNSRNKTDGKPVDVSRRHGVSKQLSWENDSAVIKNYSRPAFVLQDWAPLMAPVILKQPAAVAAQKGKDVMLQAEVAALPEANYQWYKNGKLIKGANAAQLLLQHVAKNAAGNYHVTISNSGGIVKSTPAAVVIN